jgi:hypothetical protein
MATQDSPNLYERLGGVYSIATVVGDLIDRVMADPRLNANPLVDDAHHKVPPAGFKYLVTEMLCWESCGSILLAPRPPSRSPPTYDPHSTRCTAGCPYFPRLRALALFGRRSPQRVDSPRHAGVRKPAHQRTS